MERIRAFEHENKQFLCFDLSDIKTNEELIEVIEQSKLIIKEYGPKSVYTITNVSRIAFDTDSKEIAAEWMSFNEPYVITAAFVGATAIRKIMMNMVLKISGRTNIELYESEQSALESFANRD